MPYAYFWHMVWLKRNYEQWQYFGGDASPPLGFLSMVIQGVVLSYAYSLLPIEHNSYVSSFLFVSIMGVFFWSTHVVAAMAKHSATRTQGYLFTETIYLFGQFALFGVLLKLVYALV
jgi:hypothetical protein